MTGSNSISLLATSLAVSLLCACSTSVPLNNDVAPTKPVSSATTPVTPPVQAPAAVTSAVLPASDIVSSGPVIGFGNWTEVSAFIDDLVRRDGFSRAELEETFRQVQYVDSAVRLMRPAPPGKAKNWQVYRSRFVEPIRIRAGVQFWNQYADALDRAEKQFGVPAEIIVGIIGVETVFGRNTGNFRVMDAITTLAFAYPDTPTRSTRMDYFRKELENTLLFARDSKIDPFSLTGSYAGAIGLPQFMPGSIRTFGIDFDGDGRIDLRNSPVDAIGSVAHYLVEHGWQRNLPIVFSATVSSDTGGNQRWQQYVNQGLEAKYSLDEMLTAGVVPTSTVPDNLKYGLVDLQNGDGATTYFLGTANFFAITQYNRSFFYAMAVNDLGIAVRKAREGNSKTR
jgi:membrane-bound lytic murein transglycosylase B